MISKEEVERIAKLARLELTGAEVEKMQKDLSAILDYFDLLKRAQKVKMQPASAKTSAWRKDEVISQCREVVEKIIAAAPDKKDEYIKVKNIF
ncbi:MAG: Asp-tRNA(Asn)/Glu-tRNA(Gln) amidotransferase subunit GatC [Candidatus Staskawiczbacteria bacterium]|nr:Asp-tRNA(Asn)/Glu-tRNA(Gln) amidotransferase subunit GatC [Candidatus Staskawiczbacteria bacterium]